MGLDIRFTQRKKNYCPHCGEFVNHTEVEMISSSGRCWYPFLESIGYYVPNAERDEWYGKDMELTEEKTKKLYEFAAEHDIYNGDEVKRLVAVALFEKDAMHRSAASIRPPAARWASVSISRRRGMGGGSRISRCLMPTLPLECLVVNSKPDGSAPSAADANLKKSRIATAGRGWMVNNADEV